jgi:hypothetical protein
MRNKTYTLSLAMLAGLALSGAAQATLIDRGGGLIYDDVLNITWLQNANLAATNTFGVSGINSYGGMTWDTAEAWIAAMNTADYLGYSDWRLPTMIDTGTSGCNGAYSGTDCGYNVQTYSAGTTYSEMAYMYYVNLGNKGSLDTSGNPQSGFGLVDDPLNPNDESLFTNLQSGAYWSGLEYAPNADYAWYFLTNGGSQVAYFKGYYHGAWAVRPGDVAAVPEPEGYALLLAGLGLVGWAARRRG